MGSLIRCHVSLEKVKRINIPLNKYLYKYCKPKLINKNFCNSTQKAVSIQYVHRPLTILKINLELKAETWIMDSWMQKKLGIAYLQLPNTGAVALVVGLLGFSLISFNRSKARSAHCHLFYFYDYVNIH